MGFLKNQQRRKLARELLAAAKAGNEEAVRSLLKRGASAEFADEGGYRALHVASYAGNLGVARALLGAGADVYATENSGSTPLHFASRISHVDLVKALIASGADVNAKDLHQNTPLHLANGRMGVTAALIESGACVNSVNKDGKTPFIREKVRQKLDQDLLEAAEAGRDDQVRLYLQQGGNPNVAGEKGCTLLHIYTRSGNADMAEAVIKNGAIVNSRDEGRCTPLHYACRKHDDTTETAIEEKDYVNITKLLIHSIVKALREKAIDTPTKQPATQKARHITLQLLEATKVDRAKTTSNHETSELRTAITPEQRLARKLGWETPIKGTKNMEEVIADEVEAWPRQNLVEAPSQRAQEKMTRQLANVAATSSDSIFAQNQAVDRGAAQSSVQEEKEKEKTFEEPDVQTLQREIAKLKIDLEREKECGLCCEESTIRVRLAPCGHEMCSNCASSLTDCPFCKVSISSRGRIYK